MYNKHLIIYFLFLIFVNVSFCLQPGPLAFSARRTELIESQSCERSGWSCKDCSTLQSCSQNNIFKYQISCADQFPNRPYCDPKLGVCSSDRHVCSEMKDPEFICPDVGIYPDLTDCRRYISCRAKGENGLIYSCLFQSVFNAKLKRCITNSNCYDPIIECNGQFKTMAYAADPSLYIICRGDQKPLIKDCGSKRLEYDPALLACDFKCKDEGRFAHPTNDSLYYVCIYNGNEIVRMMGLCLPGTVFDEYYATCVYDFKTTTQLVTELETVTEEILLETTTESILETTPFEVNETTIVNEEIVENTETINSTENGNKSNYINRNIEQFSETHFLEKLIELTTENEPTTIEDEINSETATLNDEQNTEAITNTENILDSTTNDEYITELTGANTEETTNTEVTEELTTNNEIIGETTIGNEEGNTEEISDTTTNKENQEETTTNNEDTETTTGNASPGQVTSTTEEQITAEETTTIGTNSSEESLETTEKNDTQEETTEDITKEEESNEKTEENTKEDETTEKQSNEEDNNDTNEKTEEDTKEDVEDETKEKSNQDDNNTNENTEEKTKEDEDEETTERNSNEEENNDTNENTEENTKDDNSKESKENNSHADKSKEKSNESKDKKHKCKGIRCIAEWKIPGFLKRKDSNL